MRTPTESGIELYRDIVLLAPDEYSLPTPDGRPALYHWVIPQPQPWRWLRELGITAACGGLVLLILTAPFWLPVVTTLAR